MTVLVQIFMQLLLPTFLLVDLFRKKYEARREWFVDILLTTLILFFIFQTSRWDWFSYYLRILMLPALGLVGYVSYSCIDPENLSSARESSRSKVAYGVKAIIILGMVVLNIDVLRGYFPGQESINLAYPLQNGVYYVGGGGTSRWINGHRAAPSQEFALDIVRLNVFGNRAGGIGPRELSRYTIFEDRVYSPCSGIVKKKVDGLPDQVPPARDTENIAGNHVVLSCKGVEVILAHLKQESIVVEANEVVQQGQQLALVGNSGNSSQPHLHIHAERDSDRDEEILDGEGVPIRFDGRFLVRNSLFTGR